MSLLKKLTKVLKYGNPTDIQSWNRMQHDEARRKELGLAQDAANARNTAGKQAADRSQELRDRWGRLYRPMEEGLAAEYMAGYNPDYEAINEQAQEDVGQSFDRGVGSYRRNAARMGLNMVDDPEIERLRGLDETAAKVYAGNTAVNTARDRAENLTANRGAQLIALGQQRPYLASQESLAGNSALADILDYQTMERANRGADRRAGDVAGGQAIASMFAHGGSVFRPMRFGINKPTMKYSIWNETAGMPKKRPMPGQPSGQARWGAWKERFRQPAVIEQPPAEQTIDRPRWAQQPWRERFRQPAVIDQPPEQSAAPMFGNRMRFRERFRQQPVPVGSAMPNGQFMKKPWRNGLTLPPITPKAQLPDYRNTGFNPNAGGVPVYADGGDVERPRREIGGAAGETARLSNIHREEYSAGKTDKQFVEWLDENGYELGSDNMARPKSAIRASVNQNVDDRPRTPDFLFKPLKKSPRPFAEGGPVEDVPVDLETNDYIMPADVVSEFGRKYFDDLVAGAEEEPKPHYASGGLVGGIRPGQGLANFASGFRDGQMDYRRMKAFDEDREYQKKQREREERSQEMQAELYNAVGQVAATQGIDARPLIDVYHKRYPNAAKLDFSQNADGTFSLTTLYPDGKTESKAMKPEEVKVFSKEMARALMKPESYFSDERRKPTTVNTPYGSVTNAFDEATGKWTVIQDNNSAARATQGSGRGGSDVLGWKDHNQMNDDIQRLAFRRFSIPSPNGVGSILDPDGQQKAGMFKNFVFAELDKLGKSPRDLTSSELNAAANLAETAVEEQFRRRGAKGIKGAGKGWANLFDADKAAADMANYFPRGGSEPEMRAFMAQRDITDKADQDQVLEKMQTYLSGRRGGLSVGPPVKPDAGQRTPADVKAEYKAGRLSREQAVQELKSMGFQ